MDREPATGESSVAVAVTFPSQSLAIRYLRPAYSDPLSHYENFVKAYRQGQGEVRNRRRRAPARGPDRGREPAQGRPPEGFHFRNSDQEGSNLGRKVGRYVADHYFQAVG